MNFSSLPHVVQDQIVDEICERNHPKDGQNFALTSKRNYDMVQKRSRERQMIDQLPLMVGPDLYIYLVEMEGLDTEEKVHEYLSNLFVSEACHLEYCSQQPGSVQVLQRVMPHLIRAIKYAKDIHIYITVEVTEETEIEFSHLLRSLENTTKYHFALIAGDDAPLAPTTALVKALNKTNNINFNGNFQFTDETWDILATKTSRETPIEMINPPPTANFTLVALQRFLMKAYLAPKVSIRISEDNIPSKIVAYTAMLTQIGRPRATQRTFVSFDIKGSTVTIHFRSHVPPGYARCEKPGARAFDPANPHPCDIPKVSLYPTGHPKSPFPAVRIPRFFHP